MIIITKSLLISQLLIHKIVHFCICNCVRLTSYRNSRSQLHSHSRIAYKTIYMSHCHIILRHNSLCHSYYLIFTHIIYIVINYNRNDILHTVTVLSSDSHTAMQCNTISLFRIRFSASHLIESILSASFTSIIAATITIIYSNL